MAQRFTATGKWDDPWFRKLSPAEKLGFLYLLDQCDHAGVIDLDEELAEFRIGCKSEWDTFVRSGRLIRLSETKYWIAKFCQFQYRNGLKQGNKAHDSVIAILEKHQLIDRLPEGYLSPLLGAKDKDKDKEKVKVSKGGAGGKRFAEWWSTVPNKIGKQAAQRAYAKAIEAIRGREDGEGGDDPEEYLLGRMRAFAASDKARSEFCPHPATWLNEGRYDDDPAMWQESRPAVSKGIFT